MVSPKKLLILKASKDVCAAETAHLLAIADLFSMATTVVEFNSTTDLQGKLPAGERYDYLYLAAHANPDCFGEADGTCLVRWEEFAAVLCMAGCLETGAVLLLACCRGGLRRVADTLFFNCCDIDFVCGPRWKATAADITAGFHTFMYNLESRREQPSIAAARASAATGYDFFCYDRVELEDATSPSRAYGTYAR
jgi:hypothetical protein